MNRLHRPDRAAKRQRGALLIEVLVAILLCAFGLLGFVAMQARANTEEFESYQRSQALVLVEDMVSRINANRANARDYESAGLIGEGDPEDCSGETGRDLDVCEWGNLIRGSTEVRGGNAVGAMLSARGCITRPAGSTDRYVVSVVWQGMAPTGAPASTCGKDDDAFSTEALRRVVSMPVCMALLTNPAVAASAPRC